MMKKSNRKINRTPKARKAIISWSALLNSLRWFLIISLGSVGLGAGVYYINNMTQSLLQKPIAQVAVEAEYKYISQQTMNVLLKDVVGKSFVGEDLKKIQKTFESHPWIDKVNLSRQWPDRLLVTVVEHVPIARWGEQGFVNNRGELVMTESLNTLSHLAELDGQQDDAAVIMQKYSLIATQLRPYGLVLTKLKKDVRGTWSLELDNGWDIILGKNDILRKVSRLNKLLQEQNISVEANIQRIDARYENGFAIRWIEDEKNEENATQARG